MTSDRIEGYEVLIYCQLIVSITKLEENIVDKAERVDEGNGAKPVNVKRCLRKKLKKGRKIILKGKKEPFEN